MITLKYCSSLRSISRVSTSVFSHVRNSSASAKSAPESPGWDPKPWKISIAVSIERIPLLTPKCSPVEEKMQQMLDQIEVEQSKKCAHELRHEQDKIDAEKKKAGEFVEAALITAEDEEEKWRKDSVKFTPNHNTTVADEKNDTKSVLRQLDKSIFLTVQRQLGDTLFWDLPTVFNAKGESLRDSAQRAIVDHCGSKFSAQVLGNAPFAHFKVKYPKRIQEDSGHRGEKAFIYKAYYIQDQSSKLDLNTDLCKDFQWLNRNELCEILDPRVRKSLLQVLYANED